MLTSTNVNHSDVLLTDSDLAPVDWANRDSAAEVVLLCEHAGNAVPEILGDLGVSSDVLNSHRGWDIGAEALARAIADGLNAPLILQRYSRLVIDCNRPPQHGDSVLTVSDGVDLPGNKQLSAIQVAQRVTAIFEPLDAALHEVFDAAPRRAAFSIHSFTPKMNGQDRPWHAGLLCRTDMATAASLQKAIGAIAPDKTVALNEPYRIDDASDWFIPAHAEPRNLRHTLIEIRNDELSSPEGITFWADVLVASINQILDEPQ